MTDIEHKEQDTEKQEDLAKKRRKHIICIAGIVTIIIIILLLLHSCGKTPTEGPKPWDLTQDQDVEFGDRDKLSQEEIQAALNKQVEDGMINISMNAAPVFSNGSAQGNLLIVNEKVNRYPQVVEIYRDDTEELIYKSGAIPVGSRVDNAKLDVVLEKGEYPCTAYFNAINADTGELVGTAGAKITITVQN